MRKNKGEVSVSQPQRRFIITSLVLHEIQFFLVPMLEFLQTAVSSLYFQ